jgi:AcrR family transcriptional regulator
VEHENRRTRRRGQLLESQILEAAWLELAERGWAGLTMEGVAVRAGTGKASLYSRWPSKTSLVRAAAIHAAGTRPGAHPDLSGNLVDDLLLVLRGSAEVHNGPYGEALRGMVAEARTFNATTGSQFADVVPVQAVLDLVTDAQQAGRLRPGPISNRVLNLGLNLVSHYYLLDGEPPDDDTLRGIVTDVWLPLLESSRATRQ